ncbi:hypothetical protein PCE1_001543 [Barthelona sp. PCE]
MDYELLDTHALEGPIVDTFMNFLKGCKTWERRYEELELDFSVDRIFSWYESMSITEMRAILPRICVDSRLTLIRERYDNFCDQILNDLREKFSKDSDFTFYETVFRDIIRTDKSGNYLAATAGLSILIERFFGDIFTYFTSYPLPHMVLDMVMSPTMIGLFGRNNVLLIYTLLFDPKSMNIRNLLCHGFIRENETFKEFFFYIFRFLLVALKFMASSVLPMSITRPFQGFHSDFAPTILQKINNISYFQKPAEEHISFCKTIQVLAQLERKVRFIYLSMHNIPEVSDRFWSVG